MGNARINEDRLWHSHQALAKIGALPNGGCCRLALSEEDRLGRELFMQWSREAGCDIQIDEAGNIFARRQGRNPALAAVATGSHLDTQPHAGNFDGIYGVLAGLEVFRALNDANIETEAPLETIVWTNEESIRFLPPCSGSLVFTGGMAARTLHEVVTIDGTTVRQDLERCRHLGKPILFENHRLSCFIEAHIEQGPILESEGLTIGVVTGIQGSRLYAVEVCGMDGHAGTVPMPMRRDALSGAAEMLVWLNQIARDAGWDIRLTVGRLNVLPNAPSTIPGKVTFDIELRHPKSEMLAKYDAIIRDGIAQIGSKMRLLVTINPTYEMPPTIFDKALVDQIEKQARGLGYSCRKMLSGAGHDAGYLAGVTPTAMIFVPCENGISHNEAENAKPSDLAAGATVLLHAMLARANLSTFATV